MTVENILDAIGTINDEAVQDARTYKRTRFSRAVKWGAMAACFGLILAVTMVTLPGVLRGQGNIFPPYGPDIVSLPGPYIMPPLDSDVPGSVVSDDDHSSVEPLQPTSEQKITINWNNVAVNESAGMASDTARRYYDPDRYDLEHLGEEEIVAYYGWDLAPNYIPDGLTSGGNWHLWTFVCREKATDKIVEDYASRGFWPGYEEDGRRKSDDDIAIPRGFIITAYKQGIPCCCLLRADGDCTTDFGGVSVVLRHRSMPYGPYVSTQKAPDGIHNMPAGYYDIYTASFTLDGVEYEIMAQRLELEEVIKIVASIINMPYSENFIVGNS